MFFIGCYFCLGVVLVCVEGEVGLRMFFDCFFDVWVVGVGSWCDMWVLCGWLMLLVILGLVWFMVSL